MTTPSIMYDGSERIQVELFLTPTPKQVIRAILLPENPPAYTEAGIRIGKFKLHSAMKIGDGDTGVFLTGSVFLGQGLPIKLSDIVVELEPYGRGNAQLSIEAERLIVDSLHAPKGNGYVLLSDHPDYRQFFVDEEEI